MSLVPDAEPAELPEGEAVTFELHLHIYDGEKGTESVFFDLGGEPAIILTPGRGGAYELNLTLSQTTREDAVDLLTVALKALQIGEESEYSGPNSEEA